ncbi:ATP-binding protein [Natronomonas gomsonensis]|uniref:ATP-binding protein n=1 Tax=Natronomonas gomsonensis TaxID=1046043 RepID=UPI0020CA5AFC|nr:ATP-binding protein [Natronomonas gomsonensis]MCY4730464.1 ATP-binding protein [Natronomonas gomsonensis]
MSLHDRLLQEAKDANIDDDPEVQKYLKLVNLAPNDHVKKLYAKKLKALIRQHRSHPFPGEQSPVVPRSSINVGRGWKGGLVSLPVDDLTKHFLAVGQSGSGKTTLFYNLMSELDDLDIPFWAFDLKQDYRHLVKSEELDDILVLPVEKLRFNPLEAPPGVEQGDWLSAFMEVFCETQELLGGSDRFLDEHLHQFQNKKEGQPTLLNLRNYIQGLSVHPQRQGFQNRIRTSIGRLLRDAPHTFNVEQGYELEDLLQRNVVFEFGGLKKWTQNFLMEILIAWIYEYRKAQNHRGDGLRHVTFLDEAKTIFSVYKEKQVASGLPESDKKIAKVREFQESFIVADQEANKLTDSIKANTYFKVLLATGDAKEFRSIAESLKMDGLQKRWAKKLAVGDAVIQKGENEPVPVKLPDFDLEKDVTDDDLVSYMSEEWRDLSFQPIDSSISGHVEDSEQVDRSEQNSSKPAEEPELDVSERAERLVRDIVENPFRSVTERYEDFSSRYQGDKAKKELLDKELVEEKSAKVKQGRVKLFELTDRGEDVVEDLDVEFERSGRGGVVHRYWQHRVSDSLEEEGLNTVIEKSHADVYVNVDGEAVAVEVAMGRNDREVEHISDRLDKKFDRVVTLCRNESIKGFIENRISDIDVSTEQVEIRLLRQFLNRDSLL